MRSLPRVLSLAIALLAADFATSEPARAGETDSSASQARAQGAITRAATALAAARPEQSGPAEAPRNAGVLARADAELQRAVRWYEAGRFETAARSAERAARLVAAAQEGK